MSLWSLASADPIWEPKPQWRCSPMRSWTMFPSPSKGTEIYFLGQNMSADYEWFPGSHRGQGSLVNIISKSGNNHWTSHCFGSWRNTWRKNMVCRRRHKRIMRQLPIKPALWKPCPMQKARLSCSDDIGGRYSVLTAVGLLSTAAAGIDIDACMAGAGADEYMTKDDFASNDAMKYAVARRLCRQGQRYWDPGQLRTFPLQYFSEWWKQLYGEPEGKNGKCIFPASVNFTTISSM